MISPCQSVHAHPGVSACTVCTERSMSVSLVIQAACSNCCHAQTVMYLHCHAMLCCRIVMSSQTQRDLFSLALCLMAGVPSLSLLWRFSHRIIHKGCMLSPDACFAAACHSEYLLGLQAYVRFGYNWPTDSELTREGLADVFIHR